MASYSFSALRGPSAAMPLQAGWYAVQYALAGPPGSLILQYQREGPQPPAGPPQSVWIDSHQLGNFASVSVETVLLTDTRSWRFDVRDGGSCDVSITMEWQP